MPAFVWTFRNSHRGLTRKVSSFVIRIGSLGAIGASRTGRSSARASASSLGEFGGGKAPEGGGEDVASAVQLG